MNPGRPWQKLAERWRAAESFLRHGLWEEKRGPRVRPWVEASLRFIILVGREFRRDDCLVRASALTYITLLALVPILAVMFAASRGLGLAQIEENFIEKALVTIQMDPSEGGNTAESVATFIRDRVRQINFGTLGVVGLLGLILTAVLAVGSAEEAFNRIWAVERGRSMWRKFSDYLSVLTVGPILIFLALTQSIEFAREVVTNAFGAVPIPAGVTDLFVRHVWSMIVSSMAFGFVYVFLPNTHVRFRCAAVGGLLGGFLWQLSKWAYVQFQVGVAKYSALYGTVSALPIFLVWVYLSWFILLLCAEATFCLQNYRRLSREFLDVNLSMKDRENLALWMTARVVQSFVNGGPRWNMSRFCDALHLRDSVTRSILNPLIKSGIVAPLAGEDGDYVLLRDPASLRLSEVIQAVHEAGDGPVGETKDDLLQKVADRGEQMRREGIEKADLSFVDFLRLDRSRSAGDPAPVRQTGI